MAEGVCRQLGFIAVGPLLLVVGCGTTPSTPVFPIYKEPVVPSSRYEIKAEKDGLKSIPPLPVALTRADVLDQVQAHVRTWDLEEAQLSQTLDGFSNAQFGGVVLSAIGAVVSKVDVTKVGAGIAGGASVWTDHYKLIVQRENYKLARHAMECIQKEIELVEPRFWEVTYRTDAGMQGAMYLSRTEVDWTGAALATDAEKNAAYDNLSGMFGSIHTSVRAIRTKLTDKQRGLNIAAPKPEEIQAALEGSAKSETPAVNGARSMLAGAEATAARRIRGGGSDHAQEFKDLGPEILKKAIKLPSALALCASLIS
jgi:hypothetical protein